MLESMRVDLDAAATRLGGSDAGSDAADLGAPGGGEDGVEWGGGSCVKARFFFNYVIFFN